MILFIGDKPSPKMKPGARAFEGAACEQRLMEWIAHLDIREYKIINSNDPAILQLNITLGSWVEERLTLVALGNQASRNLGIRVHFKLPHPSGKNRQINDKEFIAKKLTECKEWLRSCGA